ncbi:uncharacterized protein LOC123555050 [Mercenaria mercenaria]|uniref:uncharacterized protein LOC123555050 n=1 Tax=Mercenaria mercenaria TaxID=6596 RepID=UPI00234F5453|nr:uncharacterized protein LOC123555050 [Mercenaria mercenaria]
MNLGFLIFLCIQVLNDCDVAATGAFNNDIKDSIMSQIESLKAEFIERDASFVQDLNIIGNKLRDVEDWDNILKKKLVAVDDKLTDMITREKQNEVKLNEAESKLSDTDERLTNAEGVLTFYMSDNDEESKQWIKKHFAKQEIFSVYANGSGEEIMQSRNKGFRKDTKTRLRGQRSFTLKPTPTVIPTKVPTGSNHVAFTVFLSKNVVNLHYDLTIPFDQVLINEGQGFNTGTHTFVCPVNGVYLFKSALYSSYDERVEAEVVKEGVMLFRMYAAGTCDGSLTLDQGFNSAIIHCNKGEQVWIRVYTAAPNSEIASSKYSTFSGILLWTS